MKQTAYVRVSSEKQSYDRQRLEFETYFKNRKIDLAEVGFVEEKITSRTNFKQRAIYKVLKNAQPGDIVYACQLDRFGRSVQDVLDLVDFAMERGVELVTLDGHTIENRTPMGRMILTMLAAFAEMERTLRAERCLSGTDAARAEIEKNGYRIARSSGKMQTRWGNEKGCDMSAAQEASILSKQKAVILWREKSKGFNWVRTQVAKGKPRALIIEEFNELHEADPENYSTREGKPLSKGVLSKWCREMNPLVV